jgi:hypothetical protein
MSSGAVVVIVIVAIIMIAAVIALAVRSRRRRAAARHHIGLPDLGSLSKASEQSGGGVDHEKDAESHSSTQQHLS